MNTPFEFFLETTTRPVRPEDPLWDEQLPSGPQTRSRPDGDSSLTYGNLFLAVADFMESAVAGARPELLDIRNSTPVRIQLVKHGAFYHPCRIDVPPGNRPLVVNVAVSRPGRETIRSEFKALAKLGAFQAAGFVPEVYLLGHGCCPGGQKVPMFVGQWLNDFHEFHLGLDDGRLVVLVWNCDGGRQVLAPIQVREIIRQAAFILAACYDPISMEAISGFHHAAGDLVVRPGRGDNLQVRLISVRDYRPLAGRTDGEPDLPTILDGLLVLFLKSSFQLRLDRLDGVGSYALYPPWILEAFWPGFAEGVSWSLKALGLPVELTAIMIDYFRNHSLEDWKEISSSWLRRYPETSPQRQLLEADIENHLACLQKAVRQ